MRTPHLMLAIATCITPITTACQTRTSASPTEVKAAVREVEQDAAKLKKIFCEGQTPQEYTPEEYNSLPKFGQTYITNNQQQWLDAGCGS